jgi:four helix bundle protein
VYWRASALADQLWAAVGAWPSIAEGAGRYGAPDHRRFLFIARGSACELEHWIERAEARKLTIPEGATEEAMQVSRMLNGLIRNLPTHT